MIILLSLIAAVSVLGFIAYCYSDSAKDYKVRQTAKIAEDLIVYALAVLILMVPFFVSFWAFDRYIEMINPEWRTVLNYSTIGFGVCFYIHKLFQKMAKYVAACYLLILFWVLRTLARLATAIFLGIIVTSGVAWAMKNSFIYDITYDCVQSEENTKLCGFYIEKELE